MLTLTAKRGEGFKVGDAIVVISEIRGGTIRVGFHASRDIPIARVCVLPEEEQAALKAEIPFLVTSTESADSKPKQTKAIA